MIAQSLTFSPSGVASVLSWWRDAGVDTFIDEQPRDWLAVAAPATKLVATRLPDDIVAVATVAAPETLPDSVEALMAWYASDRVPGGSAAHQRVLPAGNRSAELMVLIDMPEAEDAAAGRLLSGEAGELFDKMLGALGFDRERIWFAPMLPTRIAGGSLPASQAAHLAALARQHVALMRPQKLWLLGRAASRALLGMDENEARGRLHSINYDSGTTIAIASVHPRVLLQLPKRKTEVWADMQRLIRG